MAKKKLWLPDGTQRSSTQQPSEAVPNHPTAALAANNRMNGNGMTSVPTAYYHELIANMYTDRSRLIQDLIDPRRDIDQECGYPKTQSVTPELYRELYDRDPIAARVVQLFPMESWGIQPEVYEEEDSDEETAFEMAWKNLGKNLMGDSWHEDQEGNQVWEVLRRADILSGIGYFGVILIGIDDGKPLHEPAEGIDEKGHIKAFVEPSETDDDDDDDDENAELDEDELEPDDEELDDIDDEEDTDEEDTEDMEEEDRDPTLPKRKVAIEPDEDDDKSIVKKVLKDRQKVKVETKRKITYLRVFDQSMVRITAWENDETSPRYGMPKEYSVSFNNVDQGGINLAVNTRTVHWTRIIHVADNLGSSEWVGTPRMLQPFNPLCNLRKIYGASGEGFWKSSFYGVSIEKEPQTSVAEIDIEAVREQIYDYQNSLQRYLALAGMTAKILAPSVVDPTPHLNAHIEAICILMGVPVRIFKGSERGELASSQDAAAWIDRLKDRQRMYLTPRLIVPFINRLIALGVLPVPKKFSVIWPDLASMSDEEQARVAGLIIDVMVKYMQAGLQALMTPIDFLTRILHYNLDEAESILEAAEQAAEMEQALSGGVDEMGNPLPPGQPGAMGPDGKPLPPGSPPPPQMGPDGKPLPPGAGPPAPNGQPASPEDQELTDLEAELSALGQPLDDEEELEDVENMFPAKGMRIAAKAQQRMGKSKQPAAPARQPISSKAQQRIAAIKTMPAKRRAARAEVLKAKIAELKKTKAKSMGEGDDDEEEAGKSKRPFEVAENAYCPTGPGGGQDNSCSPSGGGGSYKELSKEAGIWSKAVGEKERTLEKVYKGDPAKASTKDLMRVVDLHHKAADAHALAYGHKNATSKSLEKHEAAREHHLKEAETYRNWARRASDREKGQYAREQEESARITKLSDKQLGNPQPDEYDYSVESHKAEQFARAVSDKYKVKATIDSTTSGEMGLKVRFHGLDQSKAKEIGDQAKEHMTKTGRKMHDLFTNLASHISDSNERESYIRNAYCPANLESEDED